MGPSSLPAAEATRTGSGWQRVWAHDGARASRRRADEVGCKPDGGTQHAQRIAGGDALVAVGVALAGRAAEDTDSGIQHQEGVAGARVPEGQPRRRRAAGAGGAAENLD